jgi:hypothetical protein
MNARRSWFVVLALLVGFGLLGCSGSQPNSSVSQSSIPHGQPPTAAATALHSAAPSSTAGPTGPSWGELAEVDLPLTYRFHSMSSYGPMVVLDEIASADDDLAGSIVLVDLAHGKWKVLAQAATGFHPWKPVISRDYVAWEEWRYTGGFLVGPCAWQIRVMTLSTGQVRTIDSGLSSRVYAGNANCPAFDLDGSQLAYAVEHGSSARPWAWQVKVVDLITGSAVRSFTTDEEINGFGLSGGKVAYSEGTVAEDKGFVYDTRLMLSSATDPTPRQLAKDAYEVAFRSGRLAWMADPVESQGQTGLSTLQRIWTAEGPDWTAVPVTPDPPAAGWNQEWPSSGAQSVCFSLVNFSGTGTSSISSLWCWSHPSGVAGKVPDSDWAIISGQDGGWVTWAGGKIGVTVSVSGRAASSSGGSPGSVAP